MKSRQIIFQIIKIVIAAGIIFWLVTSGKLNFRALRNLVSWEYGPLAALLVFINLFLASERWRLLLSAQRISVKSWPIFKLSMIGGFFNFAMPGGVGGDVVKAYYFYKDRPGTKVVAGTSVLMDRILGLYSMITMALIVMFYDLNHVMTIPALHSLFYFILILFLAASVGLSLMFSIRIYNRGWLKLLLMKLPLANQTMKVYESMHLYGNNGKIILLTILVSILSQTCSILFLSLAGAAAGIDASLKTYFLVAPLGFMATAIPISPAGVGIGQAAFYFLFNLYTHQETELGPTIITAYQVLLLLFSLIGAFFYLKRKDRAFNSEEAAN